jgi:CBS domain-containing protein
MQVKDVMNQPVHTVPADATLERAAHQMWEHDCGTIPVVDAEGRLTGIVTDRDICMAAYTQGKPVGAIPVTTAMARQVLACHVDDSIATAEELMREGQVRRVPVIDNDGRPIGIVSMNDIARLGAEARAASVDREIVSTLAAICVPRQTLQAAPPVWSTTSERRAHA